MPTLQTAEPERLSMVGRTAQKSRNPQSTRTPAGLVALALGNFTVGLAEFVIPDSYQTSLMTCW
jgi:hypothetical protein